MAEKITLDNSHLIFREAHSGIPVTEEGDECGSRGVLVIVVGRAVSVAQLDHPVVVGEFIVTQPQAPRLTTRMNKEMSLWQCRGAEAL